MRTKLICLMLFFVLCGPAYGQFITDWDTAWIPAKESTFGGGKKDIKLEATIYKPIGNGPFPIFILNHGSTGPGAIPATETSRLEDLARILMRHGFVVIEPMRRGRGASEGRYEEGYMCNYQDILYGLERAVEDIDAVFAYAQKQPYADPSRIVIGGFSRGGVLSLVYAARRPNLPIKGVVNFVGGWTNDNCRGNDFNGPLFEEAGKIVRTPSMWIYGKNDRYYSDDSINGYVQTFRKAGGNLTFKLYSGVPVSGHRVYKSPHIWGGDLNDFLDQIGFPIK